MKILFWLNGSGGSRRERKVMEFPDVTPENIFKHVDEIDEQLCWWKDDLRCRSEYVTWGWADKFDAEKLEPERENYE